jgi:hypothetical protein
MAQYLPTPIDYNTLPFETPLIKLKYIGPYLRDRFLTESFWPVGTRNIHPIRTLGHLHDFFISRRALPTARRNVTRWLEHIMTNDRAGQCVEPGRQVPPDNVHLYRVRQINECGFNAVVGFFEHHFSNPPHNRKIPRPKTGRQFHIKYPIICRQ